MPLFRLMAIAMSLYFLFQPVAAHADETDGNATEITASMQRQYEALGAFRADLVQKLTNAASGSTQTRTGTLVFKQPALIRWQTESPEPELLVVGSDRVWDYFPDEETAYRYTTDQVLGSKTMLRFLSGKARLDEDFYVSVVGRDNGYIKMELVPRDPEPSLVQAWLWLIPESKLLHRVVIVDFFGNENDVTLKSIVLNPELPASTFEFTPPKGTEILDTPKD
ncbi:outer membrane lipoprotein carrier protein [Desulfobaculum xiamenense]|uniref:Outer membrane lipoprotein carrier protein n=1 Tax=Desulfobaculum xiamenense TaxID=995050 RepID=A0A846QDM4_9BACT|nr:outer membrane lipoprotein carrier protein LolA [Desulfobaculum xiamenense]NJB66826.1 outer membrane lipoprotein carrier protein [Desulfobaculum xiamenense]